LSANEDILPNVGEEAVICFSADLKLRNLEILYLFHKLSVRHSIKFAQVTSIRGQDPQSLQFIWNFLFQIFSEFQESPRSN